MNKTWTAWGVLWGSQNILDGKRQYLVGSYGKSPVPELRGCTGAMMFETRRECREYIKDTWGYIRDRKDLREEPYCWRMPKAVRIKIRVNEI